MSKRYFGLRSSSGAYFAYVERDGNTEPLPLRLDLCNHSPTGFAWGYMGSGPAQLALALLADALDTSVAVQLHQRFKDEVTSRMDPECDWSMTEDQVRWLAGRLLERAGGRREVGA